MDISTAVTCLRCWLVLVKTTVQITEVLSTDGAQHNYIHIMDQNFIVLEKPQG